ncbi:MULTISPECIES: electron transport complex protein RnfA [Mogibacterium]|uniref:Ion-translocating oxidoreductase complex subunit A n=1 Tax=Mogibacterium timidum ATCC 33093 TaxID=1401079 RepID=X8J9S0_9FIRM|nr:MULTISPECIES: RnfABCDGE type electron transport complex subunit A [Mogibacterium]EJU21917.1 electron transport complex, RnfABCDGE type, A subunit [Mogibacterium sp. CM50]EUC60041.1 electron transport complex, RnfABCDGE type, A subunit [Mogibacterium timidum ATCC 33093]
MVNLVIIFMSIVLVNNFLLSQFLGVCSFLGVSNKMESAVGMSGAVVFVMVIAEIATWPIQQLLNKLDIAYLQTVVFILVIAALVQFVEMFMKKFMPALQKSLGIYLPLITTNCAILGATINAINYNYTYIQAIVYTFGAGVGFGLAMVLFAGVREEKLWNDEGVPVAFKGVPMVLVSATILSLSFMGFSGLFQ